VSLNFIGVYNRMTVKSQANHTAQNPIVAPLPVLGNFVMLIEISIAMHKWSSIGSSSINFLHIY